MENNMTKNMFSSRKLLFLIISLISIALLFAVTLTSCGSSVSDIVIKDSNKPRTTFVQGQELDFSGGVLTVIVDGSETEIPLSDPAVSITGYEKDTLGKQTVTVTYQEKSTTIEVTVLARVAADGYKSNYFVGDVFDNSQGKLKIAKDDGKTTTVNLNSEFVTVKTFDSSKAGDSVVTVTYNDGTVSYDASFTVKIHEISEVIFTKPRKTVYSSHDTELSLAGGYFTVKASGTDLSAPIPLTADMATGFDLSAATPAHRVDPLKQTIVFTYAGKSFNFEISILYSGVSVVMDAAKALANVEITDRETEISPELSAIAVDAAIEYFNLTTAKKVLIEEEDVLKVMRPAAFCVYKVFLDTVADFSHILSINSNGNLVVNASSYDDLKAAISEFENKNHPFNVYATVLNSMKEEFEDVLLFEEEVNGRINKITISTYIKSPSSEELSFYVDLFKYMLNVSDILSVIPDNWTQETLSDYEKEITEAFNYMIGSSYTGPNFNGVYNSISSWREKDDFFDIIYTYYIYVVGDKEAFFDSINSENGLKLHLPGELQDWYTSLSNAAYELNVMMSIVNNLDYRLYDTTRFVYHYNKVVEATNSIKSSDSQLHKEIYEFIGGDYMTYSILEHPQTLGFLYHAYTMVDSDAFMQTWDSYMALAAIYYEVGKLDLIADADKLNAVLNDMANLTTGELYGFICSLHFLYSEHDTDKSAFDHKDDTVRSILAYFMAYYDAANFGSDGRVLMQLLLAAEKCAVAEARGTSMDDFRAEMTTFLSMFNKMSEEKQDKFMSIASGLYNKYVGIYNNYGITEAPALGDAEDDFNALVDTLEDYFKIIDIIYSATDEETKKYYTPLLVALSEKILLHYNGVIESDVAKAEEALYTVVYSINGNDMTLGNAVSKVQTEFYSYLIFSYLNYGTTENPRPVSFWVTYSELTDLRAFMASVSEILMTYHEKAAIDAAAIEAVIMSFRNLEVSSKSTFYLLGMNIYYDMLCNYFVEGGTASEELVRAILQAEIGYVEYCKNKTDAGRIENFDKQIKAAKLAYNSLTDEQREALDPILKELYDYYAEKHNEILE